MNGLTPEDICYYQRLNNNPDVQLEHMYLVENIDLLSVGDKIKYLDKHFILSRKFTIFDIDSTTNTLSIRYKYTYLAIPFSTIIFKEYRQKTKVDKIEFLLNCLESSSIIIHKKEN
jgi:hypothetical protein